MSDNLVGAKLGNYRLERMLGRGRMGVVYLAHDEALLRPTAVKILSWSIPDSEGQNPEAWFIAEARNIARVNHPHVVQIYSVARHGAYCYIAMEYIEGTTADALIARDGPFSHEQATELLIQTAGALQAAHDANVIHRDIKPENLLVGRDGKAKLGDFGMALNAANLNTNGAGRAGTPYYTAPEIWTGGSASVSTDIYALGATFFYLLTGRPPFLAKELQELASAHLNAEVPEIAAGQSGILSACHEILRRCMAKSPHHRFASAQSVGWEARAALRRMASMPPPSVASLETSREDQHGLASPRSTNFLSQELKSIAFTSDDWRSFYGFIRDPFGRFEPGETPYQGNPFATTLAQLDQCMNSTNGAMALLLGSTGIGKTTVARELLAQQGTAGLCAHITCGGLGSTLTIVKKALRAFGMPGSEQQGFPQDLDNLIEHCLAAQNTPMAPLLIIDDCELVQDSFEEILSLATAAQLTDSLRLLLLGDATFEARWSRSAARVDKITWQTVHISTLHTKEVAGYVDAWMNYALAGDAAPILFTPDALLILAHRSRGIAQRINPMVSNMLMAGAAQKRRVLDSWDAWSAPEELSSKVPATRPEPWPTPDVLEILNHCRHSVGIQPRGYWGR